MRLGDWTIVAILLALCGVVVVRHFGHAGEKAPAEPPILVGEALDASIRLKDIGGIERTLADWVGAKATVLYSWKVSCPCIDQCESRIADLMMRYGKPEGVIWVAVEGEPEDRPEHVLEKMGRLHSRYKMLLDPEQVLIGRLGFDRAAQVAVLDAGGHLRYRGAIDDDYTDPTRSYLEEALSAVMAGRAPPVQETDPVYGCEYSQPPSCLEPSRLAPKKKPAPSAPSASTPTRRAGPGPGG